MNQIFIAFLILVLAMLACGNPAPEYVLRGWTVTPSMEVLPTQTPYVVTQEVVMEQLVTGTPIYIEITNTPEPVAELCVLADVAVHLRPSPSTQNYPIEVLANETKVQDLGGRDGKWWFVSVSDKQGWVDSNYLADCR